VEARSAAAATPRRSLHVIKNTRCDNFLAQDFVIQSGIDSPQGITEDNCKEWGCTDFNGALEETSLI
jgi:hypothetical protein